MHDCFPTSTISICLMTGILAGHGMHHKDALLTVISVGIRYTGLRPNQGCDDYICHTLGIL